jgi:hypothetical protein
MNTPYSTSVQAVVPSPESEPAGQEGWDPAYWYKLEPQLWDDPEPSPVVVVKFKDDTGIRVEEGEFRPPDELPPGVGEEFERFIGILRQYEAHDPVRLFTRSDQDLHAERQEVREGRPPDLTQYFWVTVDNTEGHEKLTEELMALEFVEVAYTAPLPAPPPAADYYAQGRLRYLDEIDPSDFAPCGLNVEYAWDQDGGKGVGITIAVVDYHWNKDHHDLPQSQIAGPFIAPVSGADTMANRSHGAAVLGVLLAIDENMEGVRGMVPRAGAHLYAADTGRYWWGPNVADAISLATGHLSAGHVLLIEQQTWAGIIRRKLVPVEYHKAEFDAIVAATQKGLVVVEAAGNGGQDLDASAYMGKFSRDSGAILVGAGAPEKPNPFSPDALSRDAISNFANQVKVQGWGARVVSLGYGDLHPGGSPPDPGQEDDFYSELGFAATSSAAALVAGAVASLQGIRRARMWALWNAFDMRAHLVNTGTPQQGNTAEHVGPLPDLRRAIDNLVP